MDLRVSIFQRTVGRMTHWHSLGLGRLEQHFAAADVARVQQRMADALREQFAKLWPADLERFEFVRGRRLELEVLEFAAVRAGTKVRFRGPVPLIIEPRGRGPADGEFVVVYHPLRAQEWFVHESGRSLADEASMFFRERWADLEDEELERLKSDDKKRDRLRLLAVRVQPKGLAAKLEDEERPSTLALVGGVREQGHALLTRLGTDQTLRASEAKLDPGMSRESYRTQLQQLLCGERKRSILLVGSSGVGKSVLVRRLVLDLLEAEGFPMHRNLDRVHAVWSIAGRRIIAGMSYVGQWEQRCVDLLEACKRHRVILWVLDIAAWGRIGESRESERSLATLFRGPVARGELTMIGECSPEGLRQLQDDALEFAEGFTTVFVEPTDRAQTMRMLIHEARKLEVEHHTAFDPRTFRAIYELGGALGAGMALPGKVLDVLRRLATRDGRRPELQEVEAFATAGRKIEAIKAYRRITGSGLTDGKRAVERYIARGSWAHGGDPTAAGSIRSLLEVKPHGQDDGPAIGPHDVVRLLSDRTGMPTILLAPERPLDPDALAETLQGQIMGQPDAVVAMRDLIVRIKAGLVDADRPYGVYLFTGPTGTGKTEMAKCVAEYLYGGTGRLVRLDMSEFNGPDAVARLVGDRFRPEGVLTSSVRTQPFCVVLLDEIEKAHPSALNLLLQLFDDGRLTDATGTAIDFTHTVIIMTSNLGAQKTSPLGWSGDPAGITRDIAAAVREFFAPELFNRIDRIVSFAPLSERAARSIAERELGRLLDRRGLTERNIFVRFTPAVVDLAVREGFAARDGARSLKRYLEDRIGAYLADEIANAPASAVRMFWLYQREGVLALRGDSLAEAELGTVVTSFEDLLEANQQRLRAQVPEALRRAQALLDSAALTRLAGALRDGLARFSAGEAQAGEQVYPLERLRGEIHEIAETLRTQLEYDPLLRPTLDDALKTEAEGEIAEALDFGRVEFVLAARNARSGAVKTARHVDRRFIGPPLPLHNRRDLLDALGRLLFLERAVQHADVPEQHAVLIELTRISRSAGTSRFEAQQPGLLEWMAETFLETRGDVDAIATVGDDGAGDDGAVVDVDLAASRGFAKAYRQIAINLFGPGMRTYFSGEEGCHVRESRSGSTEVVRVRIFDGRGVSAAEHLRQHEARRKAFIDALERGGPEAHLPDDPDVLLPIVRRIQFDPGSLGASAGLAWIDLEDYPLGYVTRTKVRHINEILPSLWLLRLGAAWEDTSRDDSA